MAIEKVIDLQIKSNADQAEKSIGNLKSQLRAAQLEVATLSEKFGATSREAVIAAKKAGELKDKIGDAKALTDAFNPDAKFKALTSSLSGVAGGFAAVQGGMALFGAESEDVQKTLLKVQSAMALSQGLQSVGESVDSFKQLGAVLKNTSVAQKAMSIATAAYTFVTEASTAGLKLFRLALIGTGVGAIIVGLGLLIANFDKVKKVVMNLVPGLAEIGEFIGGIVDSITDFVGATSDATRAVSAMQDKAKQSLETNKKYLQEHGSQLDEFTKKKIAAKDEYNEAISKDASNQQALALELNRKLAKIDDERQAEKNKNNEAAQSKHKEHQDKINEVAKKKQDELDKISQASFDADFDLLQKRQIAEQESIDAVAAIKQSNLDKLKTEQELAIENENKLYEDKLFKATQYLTDDAEIKAAQLEVEIEHANNLNDINKTAADKKFEDDKAAANKEIEFQKSKDIAIAASKENLNNIVSNLEASGLNKSKAGQAVSKAIALTQIGIDSAVAISKASTLANAEGVAAQLAFPLVPGIGTIARVVSYASTAASVIGNIARAKQLLSSGGSGGGGSTGGGGSSPSGGGATGGGATPPQFNVVGPSGTNQIAQAIGGQQSQPVQAYVVAGAVTTGQSLNRNIITNASMG